MAILCAALFSGADAFGQAFNGRGNGRGVVGGGGFNPATIQQRQVAYIKSALNSSDAEWSVLLPRIQKLLDVQMSEITAARGARRNRFSTPVRDPNASGVAAALSDLQRTLSDPGALPQLIQQKLAALRDARRKAADELAAARKSVKELLTVRQEAVLVTMGYLE
jgi:hypothetical protein